MNHIEHWGLSRRLVLGAGAVAALAGKGLAMEAAKSGYARVDGLAVYYEIHGGPLDGRAPIVLLHGGMLAIETAFAGGLLPAFAARRPVIALEMQGHGHTADREGPASVDRMADDVAAVLAHLGVAKAHFVGHSLGGLASLGVAVRHPERVASLTPIGAFYRLEGMLPELVLMQRNPEHPPSAEIIPPLPTEADFMAWKAHFDRVAPDPAAFEQILAKLNAMLAEWEGFTPRQLSAIRAPTLVMIADKDFTRIEHAAEMARLIPGARLAVLPGTTHMNIIRHTDWVVSMVSALTDEAWPPPIA